MKDTSGEGHDILSFLEGPDATLERLVHMTNQTSMVAVTKGLSAIKRNGPMPITSNLAAAERVKHIAERVSRAAEEVGATLPENDALVKKRGN